MGRDGDIEALGLSYEAQALALAAEALSFGGHPTLEDLERIGIVEALLKDLELALVASLVEEAVPWQRMAQARGVSRQSLNYRLSKAASVWRQRVVPDPATPGALDPERHLIAMYRNVRQRVREIGRRQEQLRAATQGSVQSFLSRRLSDEDTSGD